MKERLPLIGLTLLMIIVFDVLAAAGLAIAGRIGGPFDKIVSYFDYGQSVPGKWDQWVKHPNQRGNLYKVAWQDEILSLSAEEFAAEVSGQPVLRAYGMSFLNDITRAAQAQREGLIVDRHAGPAASPNFVYSLFEDDRANRKPGDVVILGILSSSIAPMQTFSNSSWLFEQPAPFTYPIYQVSQTGLIRIDPIVRTLSDQKRLKDDPDFAIQWRNQKKQYDAYYTPITQSGEWADISPLGRLVRRYAATYILSGTEQRLLGRGSHRHPAFDYETTLQAMVTEFGQKARAEGLHPAVALIQTRGDYPDLKSFLAPTLDAQGIPYIATVDFHSSTDPTGYKPDGHFKKAPNQAFGKALLDIIDAVQSNSD